MKLLRAINTAEQFFGGGVMVNFWRGNAPAARPAAAQVKSPSIQPKQASGPAVKAQAAPGNAKPANTAAIQTWVGDDIVIEVQSGNLAGAYRAWKAVTSKALPRLSDMTGPESKAALDDMMMMMKKDDDYLVVAQSPNYIRTLERDLRGTLLTEIKVPTADAMRQVYDTCIETKKPVYVRYVSELSKQSVYWEALILPLAAEDNGRPIFALNLVSLIDNKAAILQAVFDRSPVGMIVAAPTISENGQIDDGQILSINNRAKEMLRLSQSQRQIQTIRQLGPWFRDGTEWTRIGMSTIENGRTKIRYRNDTAKDFEVTIETFSRFVLFSIVELAPTTAAKPAAAAASA